MEVDVFSGAYGTCYIAEMQLQIFLVTKHLLNFNFLFFLFVMTVKGSLVPRPCPTFHRLQYGKVGEGLVSFLMRVMSG